MLKSKKGDVTCRAVAVAKPHDGEYETTFIHVGGRRVEHIMCAKISGDTWLLHPGGVLHHSDLFKTEVRQNKQPRLNAPTQKIDPIRPCEQLNKLMAIAHWRAEIERACLEGRDPDMKIADEKFIKNPFEFGKKKHVFVLWSSLSEGVREHHLNEVSLSSLAKFR